jgi:hypothetical protein
VLLHTVSRPFGAPPSSHCPIAQCGSIGVWVVPSKKYSPSTTTSARPSPVSTSPNSSFTILEMLPLCPSFFGSWIWTSVRRAASSGSRIASSTSYSTWIRRIASLAVSSSTAATAATASPMWRTRSVASACSSGVHTMIPYGVGISAPVTTACTPSIDSASDVSIETIRAWGCGDRRIFPCSIPGRTMSSVYCARPVLFARPSSLRCGTTEHAQLRRLRLAAAVQRDRLAGVRRRAIRYRDVGRRHLRLVRGNAATRRAELRARRARPWIVGHRFTSGAIACGTRQADAARERTHTDRDSGRDGGIGAGMRIGDGGSADSVRPGHLPFMLPVHRGRVNVEQRRASSADGQAPNGSHNP